MFGQVLAFTLQLHFTTAANADIEVVALDIEVGFTIAGQLQVDVVGLEVGADVTISVYLDGDVFTVELLGNHIAVTIDDDAQVGAIHMGSLKVAIAIDFDVETDTTLTQSGLPADAKAVGDAIASIEPGLSDEVKEALRTCFQHVAWIDEHGQDYYDALEDALYADVVEMISAVFNQGSALIYESTPLDDLRQYLTVTATYGDGTSHAVLGYSLSGTLTVGTSVISASYGGKTATFNVTVSPVETPKRYISQEDIASHVGIGTITVENGTISESSPATFSGVIFDQTITKMWFILHTHLDSRRRPRYIFRKDADGSFYAIDENMTSPKLYKFTLDTGGTKYDVTQISDISSVTTLTKTGDYSSTLEKEMTLSNGVLTIADDESSVSFTNANCFGYWQAAYNSNIKAGMFDECEVEADE